MKFIGLEDLKKWEVKDGKLAEDMKNRDIVLYQSSNFCAEGDKKSVEFGMTCEFRDDCLNTLSAKQKSMMVYYILKYKENIIFTQDDQTEFFDDCRYISAGELERTYPSDISHQISMIIENLISYSIYVGNTILVGKDENGMGNAISRNVILPWLFMPEEDDINISWEIYRMLVEEGYLKRKTEGFSTDGSYVVLRKKAWDCSAHEEQNAKKIFIAMSYKDDYKLRRYENEVKTAIERCGCKYMIIRDKEHNNYIPTEIIHEITTSAAVIGDLTEQNNGVYFEIGYAMGRKVPVIITCEDEEEQKGRIHFDVKQINTIYWKSGDMKDFEDRLVKRIKATVRENEEC